MDICVRDKFGPYCIATQDGEALYDLIHSELLDGKQVRLDFDGVKIATASFLVPAIGQLTKDLSEEQLDMLLAVTNLAPVSADVLDLVLKDSREYHSNPVLRRAIDRVMADEAFFT